MITVAPGLWRTTLDQLRSCGAGRNECVVYWTSRADAVDVVDDEVHPHHTATPGHYETEQRWLHRWWLELAQRQRSARVQIHTHGGRAGHSMTDDAWPLVHSPGFLSLVVPRFASEPVNLDELYLVELDAVGRWQRVDPRASFAGLS